MPYPPRPVIAVDVDGTLQTRGKLNARVVDWLRAAKAEGYTLNLWSAQGEDYARETAERFGVADLFNVFLSKPGYILDDKGWNWIRYTKIIRSTLTPPPSLRPKTPPPL